MNTFEGPDEKKHSTPDAGERLVLPPSFVDEIRTRYGSEQADDILDRLQAAKSRSTIESNPAEAMARRVGSIVPGASMRRDETSGTLIIDFAQDQEEA